MTLRISAIICTLNRAEYLRKALQSLAHQTLPQGQYEIIVVDNGSTDNTSRMVHEEFAYLTNLRYLHEPILGLSQARNTGWRNARGEYVAYLDDDAIACPQWLEQILRVFETVKPKPGSVGGRIEPIWEADRPRWLSDGMLPQLTILDLSESPITLNEQQWLAGANIAFPRCLVQALGGFQTGLDRKGGKLLSMGDTLLHRQLEGRGYRSFYHPDIAVQHHVPASRLTKTWFARRAYWQGVSEAIVRMHLQSLSGPERLRLGTFVAGKLLLSPHRLANLATPTDNPKRFASKCSTLSRIGYVMGLWGIAK